MDGGGSLFTSRRERRLWLCALAVLAGIYATLGLTSLLVGIGSNQALGAFIFLACMFLIGVVIITQAFKVRPRGLEIGVGIGLFVVFVFVLFRMALPERTHLIEYTILAVFVYEALAERAAQGRRVPVPWLLAIGLTTLLGALDEAIQLVLPARHFDPVDILFNTLAAVFAVIALTALAWARRFHLRRRSQHV